MDQEKLPVVSSLGWYVSLPEPAEGVVRRHGSGKESDPPEILAALAQAYLLLFQRQPMYELLERLDGAGFTFARLADALRADDMLRSGDHAQAHNMYQNLMRFPGHLGAWATLRAAEAMERLGRPEEVEQLLVQAPHRQDEPPLLRAMVTSRLHFRRGQLTRAVATLEGANQQVEQAPWPLVPSYHRAMAIYLTLLDDVPRAMLHHRHALEGFLELGDRYMLSQEYLSLGQTYLGTSELDLADFFFRKAAGVVGRLEHPQLEALLCSRQGMLALIRGDLTVAQEMFQRDLTLCQREEFIHGRAYARRNLGKVMVRLGEPEAGVQLISRSLEDFEACHDLLNQELSRLEEASALLAQHGEARAAEVQERLDRVSRFFTEQDRQELAAQVGAVQARLLVRQGKKELALREMEHTAHTMLQFSRPDRLIESLLSLAVVLQDEQHREEAVQHLAWAYREAVKAGRPRMAAAVLERLGQIDEQALMSLVDEPPLPGLMQGPPSRAQYERFYMESRSPAFLRTLELCEQVAPTDETVLIQGETGSGKDVLAHAVHEQGGRAQATFLALNCGAIAEGLVESEFFGHERGSFTDAKDKRVGVFEAANGGVVFLDEVGELSPGGQVSLLRFLDDGQVRPVGASVPHKVDVRIICATNRDLRQRVSEGKFREDLYYRLAVFPIRVPPLRQRKEDLPQMVEFYLSHNPLAQKKGIAVVSKAAMELLRAHDWPGNLRELDNAIRAATICCKGERILKSDLPEFLTTDPRQQTNFPTLDEVNRDHIKAALKLANGNKGRAAKLLAVHRNTLTNKMKKYDL